MRSASFMNYSIYTKSQSSWKFLEITTKKRTKTLQIFYHEFASKNGVKKFCKKSRTIIDTCTLKFQILFSNLNIHISVTYYFREISEL